MSYITPAFIQSEIARGKRYTMVLKKVGPKRDHTEQEIEEIHAAHLMHLFTLKEQGIILMNGPLLNHPGIKGISIFASDNKEEVLAVANQDPAVIAGRLINEAYEWFSIPGAVLV